MMISAGCTATSSIQVRRWTGGNCFVLPRATAWAWAPCSSWAHKRRGADRYGHHRLRWHDQSNHLQQSPLRNGRSVSWRWLEWRQRAQRDRRGPQRYPHKFRWPQWNRRRHPADDFAHCCVRDHVRAACQPGRLHLPLQSCRAVFPVLERRDQLELPAWRPGGGREWHSVVTGSVATALTASLSVAV